MGLLDFIFGKTTKIEHEFFGSMLFFDLKKEPEKDYFECRRHFSPKNKAIEIAIDADISGPTQKQIDFFKQIEKQYSEISKAIIPLIEEEFGNWQSGFKIENFDREFEAVHLNIPRCEEKPIKWEIYFETHHDTNHIFTILMEDFDPKSVQIDG